jgi:hypothetical protein
MEGALFGRNPTVMEGALFGRNPTVMEGAFSLNIVSVTPSFTFGFQSFSIGYE